MWLKLTFTSLSQPQETMMGLLLFGEKRTQDTHSVWPSSLVHTHSFRTMSNKLVVTEHVRSFFVVVCFYTSPELKAKQINHVQRVFNIFTMVNLLLFFHKVVKKKTAILVNSSVLTLSISMR